MNWFTKVFKQENPHESQTVVPVEAFEEIPVSQYPKSLYSAYWEIVHFPVHLAVIRFLGYGGAGLLSSVDIRGQTRGEIQAKLNTLIPHQMEHYKR